MNKRDTARYDKAFTWKARTIIVAMLGVVGMLGIVLFWAVQPSNNLSYQDEYAEFVEGAHEIDEETGLPIVQNGGPLTFSFDFCNRGVTSRTTRGMDRYSGFEDFPEADLNGKPLLSYEEPAVIFNATAEICGNNAVPLILPYYPRNGVYRYRITSCYEVNPLKQHCETLETEPFLLVGGET